MKRLLFLFHFFVFLNGVAQETSIRIAPERMGEDRADKAVYFLDRTDTLEAEDLLEMEDAPFQAIESERKNFGRSTHPYWVRFRVQNPSEESKRILIVGSRAMSNEVDLYRVRGKKISETLRSGDHVAFHERPFTHRRPVFPVELGPQEEASFLMRLEGEGATIVLSLKVWTEEAFQSFDQKERLLLGVFYGFLLFVILIFSFFYFELKERSFLFYFLYVINIGLLLFSLDGFSYRFFFPDTPYMADRIVLVFSFSSILLHLIYAREYLRLWEHLPRVDRVVKVLAFVAALSVLISFSKGGLYRFAFPFSHLFSFASPIFLLACIFYMRSRGYELSLRFLLAFSFLVLGVIVLLMGNIGVIPPSSLTVHWLKFGVLGEVIFLSLTMAEKYRKLRIEKEQARKESLEKLQELNRLKDEYNKELEETVAQRTEELEAHKSELETERAKLREVNQNLFSSIRYAQRIQSAILPPETDIASLFEDHFIFFRPRDIVSGDIYWFASVKGEKQEGRNASSKGNTIPRSIDQEPTPQEADRSLFAAIDCTGHGVPGAFLSILGHDILNRILKEPRVNSPGEALEFLDQEVQRTFERSQGAYDEVKDGMDMAMCEIDRSNMKLYFAGAKNPCYVIREGELHELKGNKRAIGEKSSEAETTPFNTQGFDLKKGDRIYVFSDGYVDQFGGPKGKKFKLKPFKEMLCNIQTLAMREQHEKVAEQFDAWQGEHEQVDDVLVIGVQV